MSQPGSAAPEGIPAAYRRQRSLRDAALAGPLDLPPPAGGVRALQIGEAASVPRPLPFCALGPPCEVPWPPARSVALPAQHGYRIADARVLGLGLLRDREGRFLASEDTDYWPAEGAERWHRQLYARLQPLTQPPDQGLPDPDARRLRPLPLAEPTLLLAQNGARMFGHWLLELLPRLLLAQRLGLPFAKVLVPAGMPARIAEALPLLGLAPETLVTYDPAREEPRCADLFYLPAPWQRRVFHPLAAPLFDALRGRLAAADAASAPAPRRLYLSRRHWQGGGRQLLNRDALAPQLAAQGFREVSPELLSLPEQAALLREAEAVVAEEGSAAHLMVFAPAGARLLVLGPPTLRNPYHVAVAELRGQAYGLLHGAPAGPAAAGARADYSIDAELLRQALGLLRPG
jgi:hypothetical protein